MRLPGRDTIVVATNAYDCDWLPLRSRQIALTVTHSLQIELWNTIKGFEDMTSENIEHVSVKALSWDIAADIYFPPGFDKSAKYPAIISAHPIGSCKEQTAGNVYGTALADAGFVVIAFDASFQGASGGNHASSRIQLSGSRTSATSSTTLSHCLTLMRIALVCSASAGVAATPSMPP